LNADVSGTDALDRTVRMGVGLYAHSPAAEAVE
jgi:hypothetical protein